MTEPRLDPPATIVRLPDDEAKSRPIPRPFAYPSRYGLAVAVYQLMHEYGRIGAVNVLLEAAQMIERGEDFLTDTLAHRRVAPNDD